MDQRFKSMLNMLKLLRRLRDVGMVTIYPFPCRVCGQLVTRLADGVGCDNCWRELTERWAPLMICRKCGRRRLGSVATAGEDEWVCRGCDHLHFHTARAVGPHEGVVRESVLWLKRHPRIGERLRSGLRDAWQTLPAPEDFDAVVPIPLHPRRQAARTFNQAEVIGRIVSGFADCRLDQTSLVRIRETEQHRLGMGFAERSRSLQRAFRVVAPRLVANRRLLLVDDVLTTGSTASEAARTLREGGAREVALLTISRVERYHP
ncbi:MAG: ComF family protein [Acidobacteriota bacterium]